MKILKRLISLVLIALVGMMIFIGCGANLGKQMETSAAKTLLNSKYFNQLQWQGTENKTKFNMTISINDYYVTSNYEALGVKQNNNSITTIKSNAKENNLNYSANAVIYTDETTVYFNLDEQRIKQNLDDNITFLLSNVFNCDINPTFNTQMTSVDVDIFNFVEKAYQKKLSGGKQKITLILDVKNYEKELLDNLAVYGEKDVVGNIEMSFTFDKNNNLIALNYFCYVKINLELGFVKTQIFIESKEFLGKIKSQNIEDYIQGNIEELIPKQIIW